MTGCKEEMQDLKDALLKANNEIEKLSRIKSDFVSVISHELRTPLTSIKESVSLVLDGIAGPLTEEQKKFLTISKNNINRLAKLITDILDLSKLESGGIMMHKRKLNINKVIKDIYNSARINAGQKNIEFDISLEESVEPVWFDPDRIEQVLKNLISNAVKFSRDRGKIKIFSSRENINNREFIRIIVEDNGIGKPAENMENLSRDFSLLDASMARKYGSTGMDLAISKGIVELHGGNIWVVSEPDAGSKFIFTLPVYKKHEEFDFLIEEATGRSKYNCIKTALIIFEIKDTKNRIEDIIAEIEGVVEKTVRGPEDKVVSFKKRECVAIIAGADRPGAMAIIKRLKNNIKIPLLFGISIYPDEAVDKDDLIRKAEDDLKNKGNSMAPFEAVDKNG